MNIFMCRYRKSQNKKNVLNRDVTQGKLKLYKTQNKKEKKKRQEAK